MGEVFGTSILGGLCAYPVAICLMGKSAGDIAFYAYIVPFLISTAVGAVIAGVLVYSLQHSGACAPCRAAFPDGGAPCLQSSLPMSAPKAP